MKPVIAAIVLAFVVGAALPAPAEAGKYRAQNLNQCVSTVEEWESAPIGARMPFAGVRFYTEDGQRGQSITFCVTATKARHEDELVFESGEWLKIQDADPEGSTHPDREWPESYSRLPPRLYRNVESMRLAAAPGCFFTVWLKGFDAKHPFSRSTFGWDHRWEDGIVKHDRGILARFDDKARRWGAHFVCGGAKTEY